MRRVKVYRDGYEIEGGLVGLKGLSAFSSEVVAKMVGEFSKPSYPAEVAERMGLSKQLVGIYVRRLLDEGVLREVGEKAIRGGRARYYRSTVSGIVYVFPKHKWRKTSGGEKMPAVLQGFFKPFIEKSFNGLVVVGSPHPHGPYRAVASDGHYSFQLGLFLGKYFDIPEEFVVRLDVDVKSEKLYDENMVLIGGPGTNIVTAMVNSSLPVKFDETNYWAGIITPRQTYSSDFIGIIAKAPNPFNTSKTVIVIAGLRAPGTKAAILALTRDWAKTLAGYEGEEKWAAVVNGLDLDGDGKIDSTEVLETTA